MRLSIPASLLVLALALAPMGLSAAAVVGQPAPEFTGKDIKGQTIKLSDFKGKNVVLEWTNPECPFVKKHYSSGNMQALQKKYTSEGAVWITVNSGAPEKQGHMTDAEAVKLTTENKSAQSFYLRDETGTIGKLYDAKTTPHMFIIDKAGNVVYAGAIDSKASTEAADIPMSENYIDKAFAEIKEGKPVSLASTRSYGCGVKYQ